MTQRAKIKIIKKRDLEKVKNAVKDETRTKQESARAVVSNVSTWVNEFQKRKRVETKQAIESMFPKSPQTDSA
ncbi:MAG: hypothetical protein HKN25_11535 [Pyrinomonadaceae bacterium]|nr:hypothetical protein [Pyrinomonadaceae bacterium]